MSKLVTIKVHPWLYSPRGRFRYCPYHGEFEEQVDGKYVPLRRTTNG